MEWETKEPSVILMNEKLCVHYGGDNHGVLQKDKDTTYKIKIIEGGVCIIEYIRNKQKKKITTHITNIAIHEMNE